MGSSEYLCSVGGVNWNHSIEEFNLKGEILFRCEEKASQIENKRIKILTNEIKDPIDEIIFQVVYASG